MVSATGRKGLATDLRVICAATDSVQAFRIASAAAEKGCRRSLPKVACHLEEYIEECLTCLVFPKSHRRCISTTHGLEHLSQEITYRCQAMSIFPNGELCADLLSA